jgi:hypothetical protein
VKRIALIVALGGCGTFYRHPTASMVVLDVADVVLIGAATTTAIVDRSEAVQDTAIGIDVLALVAVPFLALYTMLSLWRPN